MLIHGPRQCGKTTPAQTAGKRTGHNCITLDDDVTGPHLFAALKPAIDRGRLHGRFLLTGSANVRLLPKPADSLAGKLADRRKERPFRIVARARRPPLFERS